MKIDMKIDVVKEVKRVSRNKYDVTPTRVETSKKKYSRKVKHKIRKGDK